ncbi:hypothetical protein [Cellulomonas sp. JH27-2]|uniref:hypothetical protein n=1 Tax=Cellulomonas sp. JH27-2 TaxID=2774139 RepID=UPI00351AB815
MAASGKGKSGGVKGIGLLTIIFGIIFVVAGAVTWGAITTNLGAEKITVSDDAEAFQGQLVDTPWEAWVQADVIDKHATEIGGGKTYAELPQDDPNRDTVMTASFLRASLFTSVVAFGVALLVVGIGVVLLFLGFALRKVGSRLADIDGAAVPVAASGPAPAPAPVAAAPVAAPAAAPVAAAPAPAAPPAPAESAPAPTRVVPAGSPDPVAPSGTAAGAPDPVVSPVTSHASEAPAAETRAAPAADEPANVSDAPAADGPPRSSTPSHLADESQDKPPAV